MTVGAGEVWNLSGRLQEELKLPGAEGSLLKEFRPSTDWKRPTPIPEENLTYPKSNGFSVNSL